MALREKLTSQLQEALKARDALRLGTLRLLVAGLTNREIQTGKPLTDDQVMEVIGKEVKQRQESIREFDKAGRQDLSEKEQKELVILQAYLPAQLSAEELEKIIQQTAEECGAKGPQGMGLLMKHLMPKIKGRADGRMVQEKAKAVLGG